MIVLEIQALSLTREGLLVDVGRSVAASGFALVRQRLMDDANGILLTMVVRGLARKQKALESALAEHERVVSFEIFPFVEGTARAHFAAARSIASSYVPPPVPETKTTSAEADVKNEPVRSSPSPVPMFHGDDAPVADTSLPAIRLDQVEALLPDPPSEPEWGLFRAQPAASPATSPAPIPVEPFVEVVPLEPDVQAIEQVFPGLTAEYPRIYPWLERLEQSVQAGARESSLQGMGRRVGAWLFGRDRAQATQGDGKEILEGFVLPALGALVEVEYKANQLHIHDSPLCVEGGHCGCTFYIGYLEGVLGAAAPSDPPPVIAMCCRSCGADECVLAIMG